MKNITIGQLAESIGISKDTIRYYRRLGFLHPIQCENGYFEYTPSDALVMLYTREQCSKNFPLKTIQSSFKKTSFCEYYDMLNENKRVLSSDLTQICLELKRIKETLRYIERGKRLYQNNSIEMFNGEDTWTISMFDSKYFLAGNLKKWTENFPFSYVSMTISLDELHDKNTGGYRTLIGCGALDKYVRKLDLPIEKHAALHTAGKYLRTCIAIKNPFWISTKEINLLLEYVNTHSLFLSDCIGGRLLFIEDIAKMPLYYFMIWAKVSEQNFN